jgi:hypothetical protein
LLGFIWWVTLVANETELSPNVEREKVQNIFKITGKDEKRNKGLTKGGVFMKSHVLWKINAVSSGKYCTA